MTRISILLEDHFDAIPDARREHGKKDLLKTILILAGIGVLGGCSDWEAIAEFCRLRQQWLSEVGLGKVMPSHDPLRKTLPLTGSDTNRRTSQSCGASC
ncbi:MAG: transposase family protein [Thermoflexales bacterium]